MLTRDLTPVPFHKADSPWLRSFSLQDVKCLVVCRGPVRKEAFEVFDEIGVGEYGMLLSEKDSIVYPRCLAPELRDFRFAANIHRVPDYMGAGQDEKLARIAEIIEIAATNGYTHLFAGYGFMAEDADFVQAIEDAGLAFIGPSAAVIRRAGAKDEAKKLARGLGNAVIPGVDDISARALLAKVPGEPQLAELAQSNGLDFRFDAARSLAENAEALLQAGYAATVELVTIEELQAAAERESQEIWSQYPGKRIRYKCIGGGGGKGQRVAESPEQVAAAIMDILAEQKVIEPGSNRNFLIELNLETTRHNEIQLIGNGDWCVSLGGRDCSIQMHEQKQLEFSLTDELLAGAIETNRGTTAETLVKDRETLRRMEDDATRFGEGVGLDNVSTFECIVEGFDHFFMEMNTRIQVEHGVTELAYRLQFTNPADDQEHFYVDRLIEAMALIELHGDGLPRPTRVAKAISGAEIRMNATNAALQPHAGGVIRGWSVAGHYEIRDDQGIGTRNPDTGAFIYYNLAGAYDSNIALILADAESREQNLDRLAELLRVTELRGDNLETNLPVQYGLINWMRGTQPLMKPNTRFLTSYLAAVGSLQVLARDVDLQVAASELMRRISDGAARTILAAKETLLLRPIGRLLADPHALAGFIGLHDGELWRREGDKVLFKANPLRFLRALYHYLHMDYEDDKPASEMIWEQDNTVLTDGLRFYAEVEERTGIGSWEEMQGLFLGGGNTGATSATGARDVAGDDAALWQECVAAHRGFQVGLELLLIIPRIGARSGFCDIQVDAALEVTFPEQYVEAESVRGLIKGLAPAPVASSDEIVTPMAGTFYAREAPHLSLLVETGQHFEAGQPLFIIEVMKMFNKILAPFAGTVTQNLMEDSDGQVVVAGQAIFKIEPDEVVIEESEETLLARRHGTTIGILD